MAKQLPARAEVVIIGGGIMGLSTAYHLAKAGVCGVVVLERDSVGQGSTCKAAGGVRTVFSDEINIKLGLRSLDTFARFDEEFHQEIDFHRSGYLFLLDTAELSHSFAQSVEVQNSLGIPSRMIGVEEALRLSPSISTDGLHAAVWSPQDGHCTPESVVLGYATAARRLGVQIFTGCEVTGIEVDSAVITSVTSILGVIDTGTVVCTAGAWAREIGKWVGLDLPVAPLKRQIVVTEPIDTLPESVPFTIDFASSFYFHREGRGLLMGMSEASDSWGFDLNRSSGWLGQLAEAMERRVPSLTEVGIQAGWAGLYEMTPDHNALIGQAQGVSRFLYAAGFSGHGFLMGPAVGEVMCDLYTGSRPFVDVSSLGHERFALSDARPEFNII